MKSAECRKSIDECRRAFSALSGPAFQRFRGPSIVLLLVLLALCLGGCGTELPYLQRLRPLPGAGHICRVAVLPFTSESDYPQSAAIVTKVITAELNQSGNYIVTQEGDVDKLYLQLRILPGQAPTQEQLQVLTSRLNVQLLFTGRVLEMRDNPGPNHSINPVLALRLEILDGHTGAVLWSVYHRRQGMDYLKIMHFGIIHSMAGLTKQVGSEIINLMFKKGLPKCDVSPQF